MWCLLEPKKTFIRFQVNPGVTAHLSGEETRPYRKQHWELWDMREWTLMNVWFFWMSWQKEKRWSSDMKDPRQSVMKRRRDEGFRLCPPGTNFIVWLKKDPGGDQEADGSFQGGRWGGGTHLLWPLDSTSSLLSWGQQSRVNEEKTTTETQSYWVTATDRERRGDTAGQQGYRAAILASKMKRRRKNQTKCSHLKNVFSNTDFLKSGVFQSCCYPSSF